MATRAEDAVTSPTSPRRLSPAVLAVAALLVVAQAVVLALWPAAHVLLIDLQVYRAGGEHLLLGPPLYDGGVLLDLPFVYPPFAAVVFLPLTALPLPVLKVAWTAGGVALLAFVVHRCLRLAGVVPRPALVGVLVVVALALDPVRTTLYLGQINLVLLALVLADVTGRPGSAARGVGTGVAAALKLTPLVFVAYLLLTGRRRAAGTAVATFMACAGIGFLVAPRDSVEFWWHGTFAAAGRISDVAATSNHSVNGLLARAFGTGAAEQAAFGVAAALLAVAALALAVRAHRRGAELLAVTLCGLLSAAVAPFAWSHHWVWFVPLLVLLGAPLLAAAPRDAGSHAPAPLRAAPLPDLPGAPATGTLRARPGREAWAGLAGLLAVTLAYVTRVPGPGVGPIPSTGAISLQPDAYLAAFVVLLAAAAVSLRTDGRLPPSIA